MDDPVQDRVGDSRISDMVVPVFYRELTGDERRSGAVTILDDFQKVSALSVIERGQPQIIKDEQMSFIKGPLFDRNMHFPNAMAQTRFVLFPKG